MKASIVFQFGGQRFEYDGGLPAEVLAQVPDLIDQHGFFVGGYPDSLIGQEKEFGDTLPTALWEIAHVGGTVVEILGARPSGAIFEQDWKNRRIN